MTAEADRSRQPFATGYRLRLADGADWLFAARGRAAPWLAKMAAIMRLAQSSEANGPALVFSEDPTENTPRGHPPPATTACLTPWGKGAGWQVNAAESFWLWHSQRPPDVHCQVCFKSGYPASHVLGMAFALVPVYLQCAARRGLPLHGALVQLEGKGMVLAGTSGSGKSTSCRRLPEPWQPLCDDETLVVLAASGKYLAHPFPTWSEHLVNASRQTWDVQTAIPLSALVLLERSASDALLPLGQGEAALRITWSARQVLDKFTRNLPAQDQRRLRALLFENACRLSRRLKSYRLQVTPAGRFWELLEKLI